MSQSDKMPSGRVCTRSAVDDTGKCWHHSERLAPQRQRWARKGGHTGGPGRKGLREARRELRALKKSVASLARICASGRGYEVHPYRRDDVRDTLELTRQYVRLTELQMALGLTAEEAEADAPDRLKAEDLAPLVGDPPDEG